MEIPVTQSMMNDQRAIDVRIEEKAEVGFDLGESAEYAEVGEINGRLIVEYEINRGGIMDELDRARSPGLMDRLDAVLSGWSPSDTDTDQLELQFGTLILRGTEPLDDVPAVIPLRATIPTEEFRQTSPSDLKRKLREGLSYSASYDELTADIKSYLRNEGITPDSYSMGVPVHLQARAEPIADEETAEDGLYGTEFTITIDNRVPRRIDPSTVRVSMRPRIGREVVPLEGTTGSYNPAEEEYEFDVPGIDPGLEGDGGRETIEFVVPQSAGADLDRIEGSATLNTEQPFTNYVPEAVFDAGGRKVHDTTGDADTSYADVNWTCSIEAAFHAPTEEVMVGESAKITKKVTVEGVPPTRAEREIESILAQRGIDTDGGVTKDKTERREGTEVTTFTGEFTEGSVVVGGSRISIDISVQGERRMGEAGTQQGNDDNLPTKQRNTTFEYGHTGLRIRGRGADPEKIESYVSDLRNELKLSLESLSEEV